MLHPTPGQFWANRTSRHPTCSRTEDDGTQFLYAPTSRYPVHCHAPTSRYPVHCHAPTSRYPVHCPRGPVHLSQSCWCGLVPVAGVVLSQLLLAGMVPVLVLMWTLVTGDWSCPSPDASQFLSCWNGPIPDAFLMRSHNPIPVWSHGSLVITCWSPIQLLGWLGAA